MREEELAQRLQRAFPSTLPPDNTLHDRIRRLQSGAIKSPKRRLWKRIVGGVAFAGFSVFASSRLPVGYVLYNMTRATPPQNTYMEIKYFDTGDGRLSHSYWFTDNKTRIVTHFRDNSNGKLQIVVKIKRDNKFATWLPGKEGKSPFIPALSAYSATLFKRIPTYKFTQNWRELTLSGPWIVRLPDRTVHGRREWVLQQDQTHQPDSPTIQNSEFHIRRVWGIDAQTGRVSWKESWSASSRAPWKLTQKVDFQYDTPMPDSLFEVPANVKLKPGIFPLTMVSEPAFNPYRQQPSVPTPAYIIQWWRDVLTKK